MTTKQHRSLVNILPPIILADTKDEQIDKNRNLVSKDANSNGEMIAEITSNVNSEWVIWRPVSQQERCLWGYTTAQKLKEEIQPLNLERR